MLFFFGVLALITFAFVAWLPFAALAGLIDFVRDGHHVWGLVVFVGYGVFGVSVLWQLDRLVHAHGCPS